MDTEDKIKAEIAKHEQKIKDLNAKWKACNQCKVSQMWDKGI